MLQAIPASASAVAGAFAANEVLGRPFDKRGLVEAVLEGERAAGGYHGDNVLPTLFGGLVLVSPSDPTVYRRLTLPAPPPLAIVLPDVEVLTRDARAVLPATVPHSDASAQAAEIALGMGGGTLIAQIDRSGDEAELQTGDRLFSRHLTALADGLSYDDPSPNTFSFNSPYGACPACNGLGVRREIDPDLVVPNPKKTIRQGALAPLGTPRDVWVFSQLGAVAEVYGFDYDTPFEDLTDAHKAVILDGAGDEQFDIVYSYKGRKVTYQHRYSGVYGHVQHTLDNASSKAQRTWGEAFMRLRACKVCDGGRLKPESLSYRVGNTGTYEGDQSIADLVQMDLRTLRQWFEDLDLQGRQGTIGTPIVKEIRERVMDRLEGLGIGHAAKKWPAELSGGMQRRVAVARATVLETDILIYDEPTTGLDPVTVRTVDELIMETEEKLGVTSIVISHDMASVFRIADRITFLNFGEVVASDLLRYVEDSEVREIA